MVRANPIPTVNEKLLLRYIRHSVYLEQLKKGEASLISRFLGQKVFPQLRDKLVSELSKVKNLETLGSINKIPKQRLTRMMLAVRKTAQAGAVKAEKMLIGRLVNISRFEAQWNKNIIEKTVPLDLDLTMPDSTVLKHLVTARPFNGHKLHTWMSGYSLAVRAAMAKQVKIGIATGESLPAIGARINKALNWKGKQAQYIARTAVSNVVHQAKEEVFKRNKDLVRKVQFVATLDDRTSIECIHLDGRMYNVGEGPRPPIHFNCRSTTIPITPSFQEYGVVDPPAATRASMNGAVPAKMNYRQWLKKQPKAVQVKVLGKKRAELWDSGKGPVKIDRFVGKDLKPLNLKQLARREGLDLRPAPPMQVKAMPIKGTGVKLKDFEISAIRNYRSFDYDDIRQLQLGTFKPDNPKLYRAVQHKIKDIESGLAKLPGHKGTTYRGLTFGSKKLKLEFLSNFKKGGIWKSKTFQSSSIDINVAKDFASESFKGAQGVMLYMKGASGRKISQFAGITGSVEKEVLFRAGTSFKIVKIQGNKVWLEEITKQAQLRPAPPITISRVPTTFAKTTEKEIQDLVTKQIDTYPEKVKVALNKNNVLYEVGNNLEEMNPWLKGKRPVGWSKGATWDNVGAAYNMKSKTVSIAETVKPLGKRNFIVNSKNQIRRSLNHETGHAFDSSDITGMIYSNQHKFKAAYKIDIAKLSKVDEVDLRFFLQEGVGRSETFADVFGDIMGGGATKEMKSFFPECTKYIEDLLK